jgi:hypothetical protein
MWAASTAMNAFIVPINYKDTAPGGDGSTLITYTAYGTKVGGGGNYYANYDDSVTEVVSTMTLMEIVG